MRILFIINALEIGGAETFLMRLMKELSKNNKVFLFTLKPEFNNSDFGKFFINESKAIVISDFSLSKEAEFLFYKINALLSLFGYRKFFKQFYENRRKHYLKRQILKKHKIDVINSHLFSSDTFAIDYLKPVTKLPVVITMQGCYDTLMDLNNDNIIDIGKKNILNCNAMTYVADKNLDFIKATKIKMPKLHKKIMNGLEKQLSIDKIKREDVGIEKDDFVIGQISRSIKTKGMEITIQTVISLVEEKGYKNIKAIIIGPENEYYNDLKDKFNDKKYILFPGETFVPQKWIELFDIGLLPTYFPSESCPSSLIEYLSCGKPVISTTIGEIPFILSVGDMKAGILIEEKDENGIPLIPLFTDAVEKYYLDKDLLREHEKLANIAFEKFNMVNIAKEYYEVYREINL